MDKAQHIHVIQRTSTADHSDAWTPWAVKIDGEIMDWADAPIKTNGDNRLEVDGQIYAYERKYGERVQDGFWYVGHLYRLQVGWQVLASFTACGETTGFDPQLTHPTTDRAEAETFARKLVTQNLASYGTKVETYLVHQNGTEYSEPVAICDGGQFTRQDAARALLRGDWLPMEYADTDEAGDAPTPPAPRSMPPTEGQEPTQEQDSTEPEKSQELPDIILTVEYHGTGAAITPTGNYPGATCELVHYRDGRNNRPPDSNVARLRLWLKSQGYEPYYPEWRWLKKKGEIKPRHRDEVYRRNGKPALDLVDHKALAKLAKDLQPKHLPEAERLAIYKSKALSGEGPFAACPGCPLVQDCPHGWGACNRKAEFAKAKTAGKSRYQLFVPGLVG